MDRGDAMRLRVAVTNPLHGRPYAETNLEARFLLAGSRIGWIMAACPSAAEVRDFDPDFVISLHTSAPKQTGHVWYGCLWHPPAFFGGDTEREALDQDGFLIASEPVRDWLRRVLGPSAEHRIVGEIQTSVNQSPYVPANFVPPRLLYAGVNWDGPRHKDLFTRLDGADWLDVYGPPDAWTHVRHCYRGMLPFDGISVINALREAGVGLCLHLDLHKQAATPSLRLFETVAAGAVVIAERHPFIEEYFGDSVLFLEDDRDPVEEIFRCMEWIRQHPIECAGLTARAHRVLTQRFTLERLLSRLTTAHRRFLALSDAPGGSRRG
jgi:hypothetical protein